MQSTSSSSTPQSLQPRISEVLRLPERSDSSRHGAAGRVADAVSLAQLQPVHLFSVLTMIRLPALVERIIVVIFLAVLSLPLMGMVLNLDRDAPSGENRTLAPCIVTLPYAECL